MRARMLLEQSRARSLYTATIFRGRDRPKDQHPVNGLFWRRLVPKAATPGDNASTPTQRQSAPPQHSDKGTTHGAEAPVVSVEMFRARSGDWFQRMQKEAIGIRRRLEPESKADRHARDG